MANYTEYDVFIRSAAGEVFETEVEAQDKQHAAELARGLAHVMGFRPRATCRVWVFERSGRPAGA